MPRTRHGSGSVLAVLAVFAAAGFVMGQTLSRLPAVRDQLDAGPGELGLALMGMGAGSLLAMPFSGRLVDRFGSRAVVSVTVVLACLGWAGVAVVPSVPVLLATLVLTGVNVGVWDVTMNIQGAHVERARPRAWMPQFHAAFSGGAVLGAGSGALAAYLGVGLVQLPVLAAIAAVVGVVGAQFFVREDDGEPAEEPAASPQNPARPGITRPEVLIGLVALAAALAEGAANDWLALLLVDVHDAPEAFGALTLTAFNLTMMVGRLLGGPATDRFGRDVVVRTGGILAVLGILIVVLVPSLSLALLGGLLWGLGISTVFPAAMSAAGEVPGRGNRAITVVSTIAYGAFLFGAPAIGLLAEWAGLDRALFLVVGFLALMVLLAPVMKVAGYGGMPLLLRPPTVADEPAMRRMHEQLAGEGFQFLLADGPWSHVLAQIEWESRGVGLPEGRVPADFLVAEVDGVPVGRVSVRHRLNDFLLQEGGHIGYAVAPEFRRRGYATQIVREAVQRLAALGVDRVLITCDEGNQASAGTIEKAGGVLEDVRPATTGPAKRRYWIRAR